MNSVHIRRPQLEAQNLFLTYPKCTLKKEEVYNHFINKFDPLEILVAHEYHEDGTSHLHVFLKHNRRRRTNFVDLDLPGIDGMFHGNYQPARNRKKVVLYCSKHEDYIANFDVKKACQEGQPPKLDREAIGRRLIQGEQLDDLVTEFPRLLFSYSTLKQNVNAFDRDNARVNESLPLFLPNPWGKVLPTFKKAKCRHYWFFSRRPNVGKTFLFAKPLEKEYGAVIQTGDFTYWNISPRTRLLILDEYNTARLKWDQLNAMADGTFNFRIFYGGLVQVPELLVVILSNQSIRDLYPHMNEFIYARFKEFELN